MAGEASTGTVAYVPIMVFEDARGHTPLIGAPDGVVGSRVPESDAYCL